MPAVYADIDAAFRRVEVLKQSGIWPGVICHGDGTFTLTYDPEASRDGI